VHRKDLCVFKYQSISDRAAIFFYLHFGLSWPGSFINKKEEAFSEGKLELRKASADKGNDRVG
jgi:hypothetical protein